MNFASILLLMAAVFGLCFLVDRGFQKLFRSQAAHHSGKTVRLSKRYGSFGLILLVLGLAAVFAGMPGEWVLMVGGGIVLLMGAALVTYYMSHGIFYDDDTFIVTGLGKKSRTYAYRDIRQQMLYNNQGYLLVELHMADGKAVQVQSTMTGCVEFLDHAFACWCRQTGRREEDCQFHDKDNSIWFPPVEV